MSSSSKLRTPSPRRPAAPPSAAAAFAKIEPELDKLEPEGLAYINLDIPQAVSVVLGALPNLAPLRPAIQKALPEIPISRFDKLEAYALGAWYAHLLAFPVEGPSNPVKPLLDEAAPLRANLLADAEALARRSFLDPAVVEEIRAGHGHIDTANDLVALSALFTASWSQVAHRTGATEAEVRRAGELGTMLLGALGVRGHSPPSNQTEASERRARAFTLFIRAYDETRRAVTFLRWHEGDADTFAPSLYKGRGGRGSPAPEAPETPEPPAAEGEGAAAAPAADG